MTSKAYMITSTNFEDDKQVMKEVSISTRTPSFDVWEDTHIIQHLNIENADQWGRVRITKVELAEIQKDEPNMNAQEKKSLKAIESDFAEADKKGFKFVEYVCY